MAKRTWDDAIKRGLNAYVNRNQYAYFYGAKGQKLTEAVMNNLIAAEPKYFAKYTAEEIAQIKRNSLNKIGYDCSGFVGWVCTGDCQYSAGQKANSVPNASLAAGVAGSILFTTYGGTGRHIGIDMGYGYFLHMAWESTDSNIANGKASICLEKINGGRIPWEYSGRSNVIDYTGADAR